MQAYCTFLGLRKAFDVAWRDGARLQLYRAGIPMIRMRGPTHKADALGGSHTAPTPSETISFKLSIGFLLFAPV